jgi:hypothetical protein
VAVEGIFVALQHAGSPPCNATSPATNTSLCFSGSAISVQRILQRIRLAGSSLIHQTFFFSLSLSDAEFMQYRRPVGLGPS